MPAGMDRLKVKVCFASRSAGSQRYAYGQKWSKVWRTVTAPDFYGLFEWKDQDRTQVSVNNFNAAPQAYLAFCRLGRDDASGLTHRMIVDLPQVVDLAAFLICDDSATFV